MGVSPKHWGREGWKFIHWVALTYPHKPTDKDKKNYYNLCKTLFIIILLYFRMFYNIKK